jgi:Rrf2 family transcriptional regulator, iron-sulfur cluster assembly transcription factor
VELNTKGRYAVTAMADLAKFGGGGGAVPLSAIAERQRISLAYLEQLFVKLRRAGLVRSERGRAGGYRLDRAASQISVAEVMRAVDEGVRMTRCNGEEAAPCVPGARCLTHGLWDALGEQIAWFLDNVMLDDVVNGTAPAKIGRQQGSDPSLSPLVFIRDAGHEGSDPFSRESGREGPDPAFDLSRIGEQ